MSEARAIQRTARQSPYKVRLVIDQVRGMNVNEALALLKFSKKHAAKQIEKVLKSAIANCEDRGARNVDSLRIVEACVDGGPMFKRMLPRSRGMANVIRRRFAHIRVVIDVPELA